MTNRTAPPDAAPRQGGQARAPGAARRTGPLARIAGEPRIAWAVAMVLAAALGLVSVLLAPLAIAERDRQQVREVAGAMAARVATFSADDLDGWAESVTALATAEYAEEVGGLLDGAVREELAGAGVASRGEVTDLYVQALDGSAARVFAVVRQTTTSDAAAEPASSTVRLVMSLSRTPGQWRVSGVSVLPDPSGPVLPGSR